LNYYYYHNHHHIKTLLTEHNVKFLTGLVGTRQTVSMIQWLITLSLKHWLEIQHQDAQDQEEEEEDDDDDLLKNKYWKAKWSSSLLFKILPIFQILVFVSMKYKLNSRSEKSNILTLTIKCLQFRIVQSESKFLIKAKTPTFPCKVKRKT
jgi:C4-dicarboxylate transporter